MKLSATAIYKFIRDIKVLPDKYRDRTKVHILNH